MVKFTELIEASFEWTVTLLLRPFQPKKWVILAFCGLMAGTLSSSFVNFNLPSETRDKTTETEEPAAQPQEEVEQDSWQELREQIEIGKFHVSQGLDKVRSRPRLIWLVGLGVIFIVCSIVVFTWLYARFSFVFLEDVVTNDASIARPFKQNKRAADSYFTFSLTVGLISLLLSALVMWGLIHSIISRGVLDNMQEAGLLTALTVIVPYLAALFGLIIVSALVWFIAHDITLVIMLKEKKPVIAALAESLGFIARHLKHVILYMLIKLGLVLAISFIYGIVSLAAFIGLLIPLLAITGVLAGGALLIPEAYRWIAFIVIAVIALPVLAALQFLFMCLQLPFAVFMRTLSAKFVGRLEPSWDLFHPRPTEGGAQV